VLPNQAGDGFGLIESGSMAPQILSPDEVERYHACGHVTPRWRLPDELLRRMRADLDALLDGNREVGRDSMICPHIPNGGVQGLKGSTVWLEYARIPEVLDMVSQAIGPDFLLWGTTVFGKPPGTGKRVPWHQDGEYWPIVDRARRRHARERLPARDPRQPSAAAVAQAQCERQPGAHAEPGARRERV
jgi:hypothetical protein